MNTKYLPGVAALAVMLVPATAFATTDNVIADDGGHDHKHDKSYGKNPAVSSVNDCGNGELAENVWCKNRALQLPDEGNEVGFTSNQGFRESPGNPIP